MIMQIYGVLYDIYKIEESNIYSIPSKLCFIYVYSCKTPPDTLQPTNLPHNQVKILLLKKFQQYPVKIIDQHTDAYPPNLGYAQ